MFEMPKSEQELEALTQKAHEHARREEFAQALVICQHLILHDATRLAGYRERAEVWQNMKQDDLALSDLREAIAIGSKEPVDYYNLGIALLKRREAREAVEAFSKAIEIGTAQKFQYYTQSSRFHRAAALISLGMAEEALADCDEIEAGYSCYLPAEGVIEKTELLRRINALPRRKPAASKDASKKNVPPKARVRKQ